VTPQKQLKPWAIVCTYGPQVEKDPHWNRIEVWLAKMKDTHRCVLIGDLNEQWGMRSNGHRAETRIDGVFISNSIPLESVRTHIEEEMEDIAPDHRMVSFEFTESSEWKARRLLLWLMTL